MSTIFRHNKGDNNRQKEKGIPIPLEEILEAAKNIKYGYLQIIIQDSKIVQIDRTEKIRFDKQNRKG